MKQRIHFLYYKEREILIIWMLSSLHSNVFYAHRASADRRSSCEVSSVILTSEQHRILRTCLFVAHVISH